MINRSLAKAKLERNEIIQKFQNPIVNVFLERFQEDYSPPRLANCVILGSGLAIHQS